MFGQLNKNDSIILIQSLVMFIGSIQIINNLLLFSALVKQRGLISLSRSVMNGIINVLWKYCCRVNVGGVRGICGCV